jgi:hypothetical protein
MRRTILALLVSLMGCSALALAQVQEGDVELGFGASLSWSEYSASRGSYSTGSKSWGIFLGGNAGYFVSPRLDVGGRIDLHYRDDDDGWSHYGFGIGPDLNYHFLPDSPVVPFVGLGVGYSYSRLDHDLGDRTTDGWYAEARGGADWFVTESVAIKLGLFYRHTDLEEEDESPFYSGSPVGTLDTDDVAIRVGLAFFLDSRSSGG